MEQTGINHCWTFDPIPYLYSGLKSQIDTRICCYFYTGLASKQNHEHTATDTNNPVHHCKAKSHYSENLTVKTLQSQNIPEDSEEVTKQNELKSDDNTYSSKPAYITPKATEPRTTTYVSRYEYQTLLRENEAMREERMCKICMDNDVNIVFLPCGHLVSCQECAPNIKKCAVCRTLIRGTVKTYLS